ncbi:MAG: hypothetical protein LAO20_14165 [Acidobacteriia bacterium]|nr:hypothetical protein [Terriglobia bacterium]
MVRTSKEPLKACILVLVLLLINAPVAKAQEIRPGVWAGSKVESLSLPTQGYQAYLIGELHGIEETADFLLQYLALLHKTSGLRDVALEEKSVYEDQAQAYVEGRSDTLPVTLCLRVGILGRIRTLNAGLQESERIRVHFVDIDSPAPAIRQHLIALKKQIPQAAGARIPAADQIKTHGLQTVAQLKRFPLDSRVSSELRTVESSIRAYQQGFEVGTGQLTGSPYLEEREQAVASNIEDLVHTREVPALLVLYGADHITKAMRTDGGTARNQPFAPMALRLEQAGVKIFCIETLPLAGDTFWRGRHQPVYYEAKDNRLASGETLDRVLASAPQAQFIYVPQRQRVVLAPQDANKWVIDALILFPSGTPMTNHCQARPTRIKP